MSFDRNTKARAWTFIIYPESAPAHWKMRLESTHNQILISPLHDCDEWDELDEEKNPAHVAGSKKKPHHHCMILFNGGTRFNQAKTALESSGIDINHIEPVTNIKALTRYFCHLDNKEKAQYHVNEIISLNGAPIDTTLDLTAEQTKQIRKDVLTFIREFNMTEYSDLIYYCMDNEPDWLDYVSSHTILFDKVLASNRHKVSREY